MKHLQSMTDKTTISRIVHESATELQELIKRSTGLHAKKLTLLLTLRQNPSESLRAIARGVDRSYSTVARWWKAYQHAGLEGLLGKEAHSLFNDILERQENNRDERSPQKIAYHIQDWILQFVSTFSVEGALKDWCYEVREILQQSLHDVDRVSISVNTNCSFLPNENNRSTEKGSGPELVICQDLHGEQQASESVRIKSYRSEKPSSTEILIELFKGQGYKVDQYYEPIAVELEHQSSYIGTFLFWRLRSLPHITLSTRKVIDLITPLLTHITSDFVLRYHYINRFDRKFLSLLKELAMKANLSPQEYRILTYRLLGKMYKQIAADLQISVDTVKKTLQQVYRKTGTTSHIELFAKMFSPFFQSSSDSIQLPA